MAGATHSHSLVTVPATLIDGLELRIAKLEAWQRTVRAHPHWSVALATAIADKRVAPIPSGTPEEKGDD